MDDELDEKPKTEKEPQNFKKGYVNGNVKGFELDDVEEQKQPPEKKQNKIENFVVILSIFIAVNIIAISLFVFNVGNIRTGFASMFNHTAKKVTTNSNQPLKLEQERLALEQEKTSLTEKENQLKLKEDELNKLQQDLDAKKQELEQATSDSEITASPTPSGSVDNTSVTNAAKIYENMDAQSAAKILKSIDMDSKIEIIKHMKKEKAAEILTKLDPTESASILNAIVKGSN